jgi:hypothetical protein
MGHDADWPAIQSALAAVGYEQHSTHRGNVWCRWK